MEKVVPLGTMSDIPAQITVGRVRQVDLMRFAGKAYDRVAIQLTVG